MENYAMINFQIFPSQYEQNGDGEKCCWLGGNPSSGAVTLQPYNSAAVKNGSNREWGFHLLDVPNEPGKYRLKYVKMSDPSGEWYGVTVKDTKLELLSSKEGVHFTVRKLGAYYTLDYNGAYAECDNGNLGHNTSIITQMAAPPLPLQLIHYEGIPKQLFRLLWKFVKMDHISGPDWMTRLLPAKKDLTINKLFIPGTHDSGTEKNTTANQTQFQTIPEQVAMGVRYLDLRVGDNWELYHGAYSGIWLDQVIDAVKTHIASYPNEFFILQVTPYTAQDFSKRLYDYLLSKFGGQFFDNYAYKSNDMPTLDTAKGKIIFFARDYDREKHGSPGFYFENAIGWLNKIPSFVTHEPFKNPNMYVQDAYDISSDSTKFDSYIWPILTQMFKKEHCDWIINFSSVANGNPIGSAKKINPWVANLLMWTTVAPTGVLMIDDARVGNVANIIAQNFE
jgi:hypothetical protein